MEYKDIYEVKESVKKLVNYIYAENYSGYDPYDYLNSPLFSKSFFKNMRIIKFAAQQIGKRLNINLRTLLRVKKGVNPVTLGLVLKSYLNLLKIENNNSEFYKKEIAILIDKLISQRAKDYSNYCWGYNFEWQGLYSKFPLNTPTIIATSIIFDSLYNYSKIFKDERVKSICESATNFVLEDLNRVVENGELCFSYSPLDNQKVFNANMKAARLLIQSYELTGKEELKILAQKACTYVINRQREDGSWFYSEGDSRKWVDNFHTGYIIECLREFILISKELTFSKSYEKAIEFYVNNFFTTEGIPKYYDQSIFPIDSTSAAQSIIVLAKIDKNEIAMNTSKWMIKNMQSPEGYFYYQKNKISKNKISYMRWSNAWMLLALTEILKKYAGYYDLV